MRKERMHRKKVFALSLLMVMVAAVAFAMVAGSTGWGKHHYPKHHDYYKPAPIVLHLPVLEDGNSIDTKQSAEINFWNNVTNNTSVDFSESKYGDTALGCDCAPKYYGPYCYTCGSYGWGWGGYQDNSDRDGFDIDVINATTITNTALITQTNTPVIKDITH